MTAIPPPGGLRGRSQPGSVEPERERRQRAHGRGDHLRSAPGRPSAVAVALAVVVGALKVKDPVRSPSR